MTQKVFQKKKEKKKDVIFLVIKNVFRIASKNISAFRLPIPKTFVILQP